MKTRLTLILVLLIYIGAASHTHAQQKKVIKTMMIAGQDVWGIERSGFFNGREKWAKGFENQRV